MVLVKKESAQNEIKHPKIADKRSACLFFAACGDSDSSSASPNDANEVVADSVAIRDSINWVDSVRYVDSVRVKDSLNIIDSVRYKTVKKYLDSLRIK